jgi:hypothetical protein
MKTFLNKFFSIALAILVFSGCHTSQKLVNEGRYEEAINKSVKKLKRKKTKEKEIIALQAAYMNANKIDNERIEFLRKEGSPDNWDEIFSIYSGLKRRQERVKPLLPLKIKSTNKEATFVVVNYDDEIINAKKKASEYFYTHGTSLLDTKDKMNARKAYDEFYKVKCYYPNYKDVDSKINEAQNLGTSYVLFKMENKTGIPLPPNFETDLTKISVSDLNANWLVYETAPNKEHHYDYTILVNMKQIDVAPEMVKEYNYQESKVIPDGFEYVLDIHGNVKKDSLGNDIKKDKFKTITCNVIEEYQFKKAIIGGTLDYVNNNTKQLIKTNPIAAENFFEYRWATAIGDLNALKQETRNKIGLRPVPFPANFDMLFKAGQDLKAMVKDIIWNNKGVLN